jgi:hypothetical protein
MTGARGWDPDPCIGNAGWTPPTVCRRPYGRQAYDTGPYGRCQIIGEIIWGESMRLPPFTPELPCAPFSAQAPAAPMPWRRARG